MKNNLSRIVGVASFTLLAASVLPGLHAAGAQPVPSLTLKGIISELDQVDFDLQGLEGHIGELRKDVQAGLGRGAAIRVFDIGVGLVRNRVHLNRMPQIIGAMQRESRTDSWQRRRQNEMMERQRKLLGKHGNLYRVVEGYAADVEEKFGIKLKDFFRAMEVAIQRGDTNVDAVAQAAREAVLSGDAQRAEQLTNALQSGSDTVPPPPPPSTGGNFGAGGDAGAATVVSAVPDPNRPGYYTVTYSDGRQESIPGRDNGDGTVTLTLPNGQTTTAPITGGAGGTAGGPGGSPTGFGSGGGAAGTGDGAPGGSAVTGAGAGAAMGGPTGPLPENVRRAPDGGFLVKQPDGTERYFPADLTKGGIGTRYLGEKGTRLIEEVKEFLDLSPGAQGGQYKIRKGESIRWGFAIVSTGQAPEAGGVRSTFKLTDRVGQGTYQVTGWRIMQPDGSQLAAGAGEEASAVVTQSGNYRIEFSGTTSWGSAFRIEANVPIAVQ